MKDTTGRIAQVGDTIVYAVKHSTSVSLTRAKVNEIGEKTPAYAYAEPRKFMRVTTIDGRSVTLHSPTFMVIDDAFELSTLEAIKRARDLVPTLGLLEAKNIVEAVRA
jgi:ribosomal protein L7/L12